MWMWRTLSKLRRSSRRPHRPGWAPLWMLSSPVWPAIGIHTYIQSYTHKLVNLNVKLKFWNIHTNINTYHDLMYVYIPAWNRHTNRICVCIHTHIHTYTCRYTFNRAVHLFVSPPQFQQLFFQTHVYDQALVELFWQWIRLKIISNYDVWMYLYICM